MATTSELQKIIDQFDQDQLGQLGIFGIHQYGGGTDECFVKANKEGLILFALELLKSARDSEDILQHNKKKVIPIDWDINWIDEDSDITIQYIEPTSELQQLRNKTNNRPTYFTRVIAPYAFGLFLILLLVSIAVGIQTIISWFI
jgi:hypothetical protein